MTEEKPSVSIIVRTKDRPKLLKRAIQSISAQTYGPIEVVLVNDGGCDLDTEELKALLGEVSLHYIRLEKNTGRAHAANVGIENAKGKYIAFLDDDDIYYKNAIKGLCSAMDYGGWPVVYGQVVLKFYNEEGVPDFSKKDVLFAFPFDRDILLYRNFIPLNALLLDASLFHKFGPLDESLALCEDWDFLLKIADQYSFKYVPEIVAEYSSFGASLGGGGRFTEEEIKEAEEVIRLKRLDRHTVSIVAKQIDFALKDIRGIVAGYRAERTEQLNVNDALKSETESLRVEIEQLRIEAERLKGENERLRNDQNAWQAENERLKNDQNAWQAENERLKNDQNGLQAENERLRYYLTEYKSEVQKMQNTISWRITVPLRRARQLQGKIMSPFESFTLKTGAYARKAVRYIRTHGLKAFFQKLFLRISGKDSPHQKGLTPNYLHPLSASQVYNEWLQRNGTTAGELISQGQEARSWANAPLVSIIVPVYNTHHRWLDSAFQSINEQSYGNWEAIIVDDCSDNMRTQAVINAWLKRDSRFRVIRREVNGGVGAASQDGLLAAKGGFVMVLDHDDLLEPDALYHVAKKVLADPSADVIYSDEILMDENENVFKIVFRPDFSPDFLLSHPYIVHLVAYKKELAVAAGGYNIHYDVSQDYELLLKIASRSDKFAHIPRPLYRWRIHPTSTGHQKQDKVMDLSKKAIIEYLRNTGQKDSYVMDGPSFNFFRVRRKIKPASVDIVIPTKDRADLLRKCVDSLTMKTVLIDSVQYKIIIADNGSVQRSTIGYLHDLGKKGATIVDCSGPFNFSAINNKAAAAGNADYILFLNNDIEVIEPEWLLSMLEQAQRPEVGAVGAKLLYPDGTIQHAGVLIGINGVAGHSHQFYPEFTDGHIEGGHMDSLLCIRECMAVTAACMMMRRSVFEEVGGFDENFVVGFGDTDLCLRIYAKGYKTVWTPYARLIHNESASRGKASFETHREDTILMRLKWEEIIKKGDPFYNPNLSLRTNIFSPR